MTVLDDWIDAACAELGIDRGEVEVRAVLDLARDVAHQVDRPAAPVTSFLLGLAVGAGLPLPEAVSRLSALAAAWAGESASG
jgi:Domain of unknown function (DUF6457)